MDFGFVVLWRLFFSFFFGFNNSFLVVLPVTFSNTDFEIFFHISSVHFFGHGKWMLYKRLNIFSAVKQSWSWPAESEIHLSSFSVTSFPHLSNPYILSGLLLSAFTCSSSSCSIPASSSTGFQRGCELPQPLWVSGETELPGVLTQYSRAGTALHKHLNHSADGSWKKICMKITQSMKFITPAVC